MRKPTKTLISALRIIKENTVEAPHQFGKLLWPDNPSWKRRGKAGPNGVAKGTGMNLASGGYLGKLQKRGLIRIGYHSTGRTYRLTEQGENVLREWSQAHEQQAS